MDDGVTRIFIKFITRKDNEVFWGMWFSHYEAIDWATNELKTRENQSEEDPFIGYQLVYTNVLRDRLGATYAKDVNVIDEPWDEITAKHWPDIQAGNITIREAYEKG